MDVPSAPRRSRLRDRNLAQRAGWLFGAFMFLVIGLDDHPTKPFWIVAGVPFGVALGALVVRRRIARYRAGEPTWFARSSMAAKVAFWGGLALVAIVVLWASTTLGPWSGALLSGFTAGTWLGLALFESQEAYRARLRRWSGLPPLRPDAAVRPTRVIRTREILPVGPDGGG